MEGPIWRGLISASSPSRLQCPLHAHVAAGGAAVVVILVNWFIDEPWESGSPRNEGLPWQKKKENSRRKETKEENGKSNMAPSSRACCVPADAVTRQA